MSPTAKELNDIAERFALDLIILFGSRATGKSHPESDWDIAVRSRDVLSLDNRLDLIGEFERYYGSQIDLVDIRTAGPVLLACMGEKGKSLFEKGRSTFAEFKLFALMQYRDARPLLDAFAERNRKLLADISEK